MKKHLKLLGLWLALALACAALFCGVALADGAQPSVTLSVEGVVFDANGDGVATGSPNYRVNVVLENADTFEWTWEVDDNGHPVNWWEYNADWLRQDDDGLYFITYPDVRTGEEDPVESDVVFVRAPGAEEYAQKLTFNYETCAASATITNEDAPSLMTPFTLTWGNLTDVPEGDYEISYQVCWCTPDGRRFVSEDNTGDSFTIDDRWDGGLENTLSVPGQYQAAVIPIVDGCVGKATWKTFDVNAPEADPRVVLNVEGVNEQGECAVGLHDDFEYTVYAPGADDNRVEICYGDGKWDEKRPNDNPRDEEQYGFDWGNHAYHDEELPEYDAGEAHRYTVYARASFNGQWVFSNSVDILVSADPGLALVGPVTYTVTNTRVARDGLVQIEVDPVQGAEFYEAFIDGDYGWITCSHWVDAEKDGATLLTMPVAACEPGEYKVGVYAGRRGRKYLFSEDETTITVTGPRKNSDILFSMKNSYETNEPLKIAAYYNNEENFDNLWMEVRVSPKDDPNDEIYHEGEGIDFRDDGFSIALPGSYVVEATVRQNVENEEPQLISRATHEFAVVAPNGKMDIEYNIDLPSVIPVTGDEEVYTIHVPFPDAPVEWMDVKISDRDDNPWNEDWGICEGRDFSFHTWPDQNVTVEVWGFARGYEPMYYRSPRIPVGELNNKVHLTVDDESLLDEAGVVHAQIDQNVDMTVSAEAGEIQTVRFFGGYDFWDDEDPDDDGMYRAGPSFGDEGPHTVYAMVTFDSWKREYDALDYDPRTWYVSNSVEVDVDEPAGEVPAFSIALDKSSAARGDEVRVTFTRDAVPEVDVEYEVNLWHDFEQGENWFDYDWHWQWAGDWTDAGNGKQRREAIVITAGLPEVEYKVAGTGRYIGYAQYHTNWDGRDAENLTITQAQVPENSVRFTVSSTEVETEEQIGISIFAPGADWIDLYLDYENDEDRWDSWGGDSVSDSRSYSDSGEYTLLARAWYPCYELDEYDEVVTDEEGNPVPLMKKDENGNEYHEHWSVDSERVTVKVTADKGALDTPVAELPAALYINSDGTVIDDLPFRVYRPENAEGYGIDVNIEDRGGDEGHLLHMDESQEQTDDEGNAFIEGVVPGSLMAKRGVRQMDVIRVHFYAEARGYEGAGNERRIAVTPAVSDKASIVAVDVDGEINILSHDNLEVRVASSTNIKGVRLFDGNRLWEEDGPDDWENPTYFQRGIQFDRGGDYEVYALVTFDDAPEDHDWENLGDPRTWVATNTLPVHVEQLGRTGAFTISADRDETTCGDSVEVTVTKAENGENYGVDMWDDVNEDNDYNRRFDYDWAWKGDWYEQDGQMVRTATLTTGGLPAGNYSFNFWADKPGYEGRSSNTLRLRVNDPQNKPEVLFVVDRDQVSTCEEFTFSIRADGAYRVEINYDYPSDWWDSRDRAQWSKPYSYAKEGEYTLLARAHFFQMDKDNKPIQDRNEDGSLKFWDDGNPALLEYTRDSEPVTVKVTAKNGDLAFGAVDLADCLIGTANSDGTLSFGDGFGFTIALPENADDMDAGVSIEGWRDDLRNEQIERDGENPENNAIGIGFSAEDLNELKLRDGDVIRVWAYAHGRGYNEAHFERQIPVMAAAEVSATIEFRDHTETDTLEGLAVNECVDFVVRPEEGKTLQRIHFYNGYGYRRDDEESDGDGNYYTGEGWGEPGTYTVFARVTYDDVPEGWNWDDGDPRKWINTNVLTVQVDAPESQVGPFSIAVDPVRVARGDTVTVAFGGSENAEFYDLYHESVDRQDYDLQWHWVDDNETLTFSTANMPEGTYRLWGHASGVGFAGRESDYVDLTVTEYEGNDIQLKLEKDVIETNECLHATIMAPGAKRIGFATNGFRHDLDVNDGHYMWGDGDSMVIDWPTWNNPETITAVAYAQYEDDGEWVAGDEVTFEVVAPKGPAPIDASGVPAFLTAGEGGDIFVPWQEGTRYIGYDYRINDDKEPRERCDNTEGGNVDLHIDGLNEGDIVHFSVWTNIDTGYENGHYNYDIPVVAGASGDVNVEVDTQLLRMIDYTATVNAPGAKKIKFYDGYGFRSEGGEEEIDVDDSGKREFSVNFDRTGTFTLYAMAKFSADGEWVTGAPVSVTVGAEGKAPTTAVTVPANVFEGGDAVITIANPDGVGSWYHVSIWPQNEDNIFDLQYHDDNGWVSYSDDHSGDVTITVPADRLASGKTYVVDVNYDHDGGCDMNSVRKTFQVVKPSVKLSTDKKIYNYGDTVQFTVTAPLANSVEVFKGDQNLGDARGWDADEISNEITFTAKAYFDGMDEPLVSAPVSVKVRSLGAAPQPAVYFADNYSEGDDVEISIEGGDVDRYELTVTRNGENVLSGAGNGEDKTFTVAKVAAGDYDVVVTYDKTGYDEGRYERGFTVAHNYNDPEFNWNDESETCTVTVTCSTCDFLETLTPSISRKVIQKPTCTETGTRQLTATAEFNGETYSKEHNVDIAAAGHKPVDVDKLDPTCTEDGHEAGKKCSVCNETVEGMAVIPKLGHEPGEWHVKHAGEGSYIYGNCIRCGEEQVPDQEDGNVSVEGPEPTCTENGWHIYTFGGTEKYRWESVSDTWTDDLPALGHDWGDWETTREPTCKSYGERKRTCARCKGTETKPIGKKDHTVVTDAAVAATCTETGLTEGSHCSACNTVIVAQEEIPALGHDLVAHDAKAPTCTEDGNEAYWVCAREGCGKLFGDALGETEITAVPVIEKLNHDLEHHDAKAPTCTEIGWDAYDTCKRDGCDYTTYVEKAALNHDLEHHDAKAPTCTEVGWDAYDTCKREGCDYTTYVEKAALNHDPEHHDAKAPTCTEIGWDAYDTCKREGCNYTTYVELPAKGHTLTAHAKVEATYTAAGTEAYWECTACHKLFGDEAAKNPIDQPVVIPMKSSSAANNAIEKINALSANAGTGDKAAVEAARKAYNELTEEEKALVSKEALEKLKGAEEQVKAAEEKEKAAAEAKAAEEAAKQAAAEKKAAEDKAAADGAAAKIGALSDNADKDAVAAARKAYDALTDDQKKQVSEEALNKLKAAEDQVKAAEEKAAAEAKAAEEAKAAAEKKAAEDKAAADDAIAKINNLPATAGTGDKDAVAAARAAYDALTDDQKALVSAEVLAKLTGSESQVKAAEEQAAAEQAAAEKKAAEDKAAADAVIEKIKAVPAEAGTNDKAAVEATRAAYNALTDDQKALVDAAIGSNVETKLAAAESQVKAAEEKAAAEAKAAEEARAAAEKKAAEDKAAADAAIEKINALPSSAGASDKAAVEAARAAYNALTDDQKALVSAEVVSKLTTAETQVTQATSRKKLTKSNTKITVKDQTWSGKAKKPKPTVKVDGKTLKKGTDYKVSYKNNVKVGKATVTIEGKGKYTGKVTATFKINPKKVSSLKLKVDDGKLIATWKSVKDVTGYQIEYSLTKDFKTSTKLKVKKFKTVKAQLKKAKAGKAYYVRIRAYQTVKKQTYYSAWSKTVKSKKIEE